MICAVTGANGFLGSHLVDGLLARGDTVRALVRSGADLTWLAGKPVTLVPDVLNDPRALTEAVTGCDAVIHNAGLTRGSSEEAFHRVNVELTRTLVAACAAASPVPGRFVLVSSLAAAGPSAPGKTRNEEMAPAPVGPYGRSKLEAEQVVRNAGRSLSWSMIRPGPIYGPRDRDVLQLLTWAARGIRPITGTGNLINFAHVDDVVQAAILAAVQPSAAGQAFLVGGPRNVTNAELAATMGRAVGKAGVTVPLPLPMVWVTAAVAELAGRFSGKPPIMSFNKAREISAGNWAVDISKAQRLLGYSPRWNLEPGMRRVVHWYRQAGWL